MILSLILSIFSVTFTLESTTEVKPSGVLPDSSTYTYERSAISGQKGQMTAGNATRLELKGWDGYVIRSVELKMRSNKSSGRGSLMMTIGDEEVWSIDDQDFCNDAWAGMYTTDWVSISKQINVCVNNEPIEISISATENSLYIHSYTIYYEKAYHTVTPDLPSIPSVSLESQEYTISFNTGCDTSPLPITQSSPNTPIILPEWQDTLSWFFIGWSETEILENQLVSPLLEAGQSYVPRKNLTLWAVYSDVKENSVLNNYESGVYAIAYDSEYTQLIGSSALAMSGSIEADMVSVCNVQLLTNSHGIRCLASPIDVQMLYDIEFHDDSTAYITHLATNNPIGYKENKLDIVPALWKYRTLEDGSMIFYYLHESKQYAIYFGQQKERVGAYAQSMSLTKWKNDALWLFPLLEQQYTSWPLGKSSAVEDIEVPKVDLVYRLGLYELRLKNGKKYLYLSQ
jgi:hypothetical protein